MSIKVLVTGGSGMLGSMIVSYLSTISDLDITATVRTTNFAETGATQLPAVSWRTAVFGTPNDPEILDSLGQFDWIINATGATNRAIDESSPESIDNAIKINVGIPIGLIQHIEQNETRVLQIATDCVYSGNTGSYTEIHKHDALDVYGKTKSLGEVPHQKMHYLRCSIIGPEPKEKKFLLEWLLAQPRGANVTGYTDHLWNGVTTLQFARVAAAIVRSETTPPAIQHLTPADTVTKAELLKIIARSYGRNDLEIQEQPTGTRVDRSLASNAPNESERIWSEAGYSQPPSIADMVQELTEFNLPLNFDN